MEPRDSRAKTEPSRQSTNPNVFDDDFAVSTPEPSEYEFNMDNERGQRGAGSPPQRTRERSSSGASGLRRSVSLDQASDTKRQPPATTPPRSSIAKNRADFIRQSSERRGGSLPWRTSTAYDPSPFATPHRDSSRASSFAPFTDRSASPTPGATGPSHPYAMYPQSGMRRSMSATTDSTLRQPSSVYDPASRPVHPYGMFRQNTTPDSGPDSRQQPPAIPVGFPGQNAEFTRQFGPDGEDQDIIGVDGHTEQLPPYSKYPDENEKAYAAVAAGNAPLSPARSTLSESTLILNAQPMAGRTESPSEHLAESNGSSSTFFSEKSWKEKTWKERRKTRFCGIPLWMILVAAGCLAFIAVVLGATIGGVLARDRADRPPTVTVPGTQSMLDASPIPTPPGLSPIQTGSFFLPLGGPEEVQRHCITSSGLSNTWDCNVMPPPLTIEMQTPSSGYSQAKVFQQQPDFGPVIQYGPQAPNVQPEQKLMFVIDTMDPSRGPALHFQTWYDKIVVLQDNALNTNKKDRRDAAAELQSSYYLPPPPQYYPPPSSQVQYKGPPPNFGAESSPTFGSPTATDSTTIGSATSITVAFSVASSSPTYGPPPPPPDGGFKHRKNAVQPGDQPWFCFWNSTFIEGFIYVKQNSTPSAFSSSNATSTTATPSSKGGSQTSSNGNSQLTGSQFLPTTTSADNTPVATVTEQRSSTSTTFSSTSLPISVPNVRRDKHNKGKDDVPTVQFPYIMKLIERRLPSTNKDLQPYCQKMTVNSDGSVSPVLDQKNHPITVKIGELDPSESEFSSAFRPKTSATATPSGTAGNDRLKRWNGNMWEDYVKLGRRNDPNNSCVCQWVAQ